MEKYSSTHIVLTRPIIFGFLSVAMLGSLLFPIQLVEFGSFQLSVRTLLPFLVFPLLLSTILKHYKSLFVAIILVFSISFIHSKELLISARLPIYFIYFSSTSALFVAFFQHNDKHKVILQGIILVLLLQPITVILFFLSPSLEDIYHSSIIADLIIGSGAGEGNVRNISKAGGLMFNNGNWAASYGFVLFCAVQILFKRYTRMLLSILLLVSVFLTGSKTSIFLTPITAIFGIMLIVTGKLQGTKRVLIICLTTFLLSLFAILFGSLVLFQLGEIQTFSYRLIFWSIALKHITEYWLFGGGPTYWMNLFAQQGKVLWFEVNTPIHNSSLNLLMTAGVIPFLLLIGFYIQLWLKAVDNILYKNKSVRKTALWAAVATFWIFVHSQISNMTMFGDTSTMVLVALIVALFVHEESNISRLFISKVRIDTNGNFITHPGEL